METDKSDFRALTPPTAAVLLSEKFASAGHPYIGALIALIALGVWTYVQ